MLSRETTTKSQQFENDGHIKFCNALGIVGAMWTGSNKMSQMVRIHTYIYIYTLYIYIYNVYI